MHGEGFTSVLSAALKGNCGFLGRCRNAGFVRVPTSVKKIHRMLLPSARVTAENLGENLCNTLLPLNKLCWQPR